MRTVCQFRFFIFHIGEDLIQIGRMNFGHVKLHLQNVGVVFGIDDQHTVPLSQRDIRTHFGQKIAHVVIQLPVNFGGRGGKLWIRPAVKFQNKLFV